MSIDSAFAAFGVNWDDKDDDGDRIPTPATDSEDDADDGSQESKSKGSFPLDAQIVDLIHPHLSTLRRSQQTPREFL